MQQGSSIGGSPGEEDTGLPVLPPRSAVFELAVIVLAILALEWLLPNQGLAEIGPSPYWLPVLLMSLHYGTVSGLLAAGVGIAMTMLPGVPEQSVGENHFAYLLRIWAQPILWIAVAVFLGQFRIRQIAVKRELVRQVRELSSQRQALAEYSENLRRRCETIERAVAGRDALPVVELLAAVAELGDGRKDLGPALSRAASFLSPDATLSVFRLDGPRLVLEAHSGWTDAQTWAEELTVVHPLYRAVVDRGERVSVLTPGQETLLSGEGLAAVPIRGTSGVTGMLKLDQAGASVLSAETLLALDTLAMAAAHRSTVEHPAGSQDAELQKDSRSVRSFFRRTTTWNRGDDGAAAGDRGEGAGQRQGAPGPGRSRVAG